MIVKDNLNFLEQLTFVQEDNTNSRRRYNSYCSLIEMTRSKCRYHYNKYKEIDLSEDGDWSDVEQTELQTGYIDENLEKIAQLKPMIGFIALMKAGVSKKVPSRKSDENWDIIINSQNQ